MATHKVLLGLALFSLARGRFAADPPRPIPADQFDKLHKMIKPQRGESRFHGNSLVAERLGGTAEGRGGGQADAGLGRRLGSSDRGLLSGRQCRPCA